MGADAFVAYAARDPGTWNQKGVIVLTPAWLAFIPTEAATSLASIAGKAALAGVGVLTVTFRGRTIDQAGLIRELSSLSGAELEVVARDMARDLGGVVWTPADARYFVERLPLGV